MRVASRLVAGYPFRVSDSQKNKNDERKTPRYAAGTVRNAKEKKGRKKNPPPPLGDPLRSTHIHSSCKAD